jgi:hypothetical protein
MRLKHLPWLVLGVATAAMLIYGPIPQPPHYHDFADQRIWFGIPNAADVLSNVGFAAVALWGWLRLAPRNDHPALRNGWPGYRLFLIALLATAVGSAFYHWAPDDGRLVWDRLPIALACAGLLTAVYAETHDSTNVVRTTTWLAVAAAASVLWWYVTELGGAGDLRPYLLLQGAPLVLIPLWQALARAPAADRLAFGIAILLYAAAKAAELNDATVLAALGWLSGHTIKHLLAALAAGVVVGRLTARTRHDAAAELGAPRRVPAAQRG